MERIEDMGTPYAKEMRKMQTHGPYFLGGYCMGGTVALEVAQQIQAQGEQVALLALFDTMNWSKVPMPSAWKKSYHAAQRLCSTLQIFPGWIPRVKFNFLARK